ncbi:MAG: fumarate reductase cytochrome b subunit [Halioglobus sp.]|nr:fumarate reductase cytochrome b subunit [Halioglobus sp.]
MDPAVAERRDRELVMNYWPARLDLAQSASGLLLVLFMWTHMALVSSILVSEDAMYRVSLMFEGYYVFGSSHPWLVSVVALLVTALLMLHAILAMRKFPQNAGQYMAFWRHKQRMHHADTTLWWWQLVTGFLLFFMAPAHLYTMFSQADQIGPYASSWRVYSTQWPLYLVLLVVVEVHAALGLYRLIVKWGWLQSLSRKYLRMIIIGFAVFLVWHGVSTLLAYYKLGETLRDTPDLRYHPTEVRP